MENYELYIENPPQYSRLTGRFIKGHIPFNKGLQMKEWMDGRKIKRVLKYLEIGRRQGNHDLPGTNRKMIVGIKDGKLIPFNSATEAGKILKAKGIRINKRNISKVCQGKDKYRQRSGGYYWFYADQPEKYKDLIC